MKCKTPLPADAIFCEQCGTKVQQASLTSLPPSPEEESLQSLTEPPVKKPMLPMILIIILALSFISLAIFSII